MLGMERPNLCVCMTLCWPVVAIDGRLITRNRQRVAVLCFACRPLVGRPNCCWNNLNSVVLAICVSRAPKKSKTNGENARVLKIIRNTKTLKKKIIGRV